MATAQEIISILIKADGAAAKRELEKVGATASRELGKADKATRDWSATFTRAGTTMVTGAAVIGVGLFKMAQAADESEQANLRLTNTLKNAPQLAGKTAKAFTDLATQIRKTTVVDDEAVISVEAFLGSIGRTQDEILTLTPLIVDLSRKTGVDLDTAARAVSKSVDGTGRALRGMGVDVDATKIKTDGFDETVRALERSVGGFAEGEAKTFSGQIAQLKNEFGELSEGVGVGVVEAFRAAIGPLTTVSETFQKLDPDTQSLIGKFGGMGVAAAAVVGGLSLVAGQATKVRDALTAVGNDGSRSLNKVGKAAAGVAAIGLTVELGKVLKDIFVGSEQSADDLDANIHKIARTLYSATDAADVTGDAIRSLDREFAAFVQAGPGVELLGLAGLQQGLDNGTVSAKELNVALTGTTREFDDFLRSDAFTVSERGAEALGDWRNELELAAKDTLNAQRAAGDYTSEQVDLALAMTSNADGTANYQEALGRLVRETQSGKRETDNFRIAQDKLFERVTSRQQALLGEGAAYRAITQSQIDAARAQDDLTVAQDEYNTAVKEHGRNSREAREAQRGVQEAFINIASTADGAKGAVLAYAEELGGTKAGAPPEKIQATVTALEKVRDTAAPGSELRRYLNWYIETLKNRIPDHVATKLKVDASELSAVEQRLALMREAGLVIGTGRAGGSGLAIGGPVTAGREYIVGEHGPETFRSSVPGVVLPHGRTRGGDSGNLNVSITINAGLGTDPRELEQAVVGALASAQRRGVRL